MSNDRQEQTAPFFSVRKLTPRQMMARRPTAWGLIAIGMVAIALLAFLPGVSPFGSRSGSTEAVAREQSAVRLLTVAALPVIQAGPSDLIQKYTGIVVPRRSSQLAAKSVGRIERVRVDIGDSVTVGQVLIELDRDQLSADRHVAVAELASANSRLEELRKGPRDQDIDQAKSRVSELKANLELAEANLARTQKLLDSAAISRQEYDEIRFGVEAIRAQYASARHGLDLLLEGTRREQVAAQEAMVAAIEARLERIDVLLAEQTIVAPFAGQIQSRWIDEGAVVSPGQALLDLVETSVLEVRVGLPPESFEGLCSERITVSTARGELPFTVSRTAPAINANTRTRELVLSLSGDPATWPPIGSAVTVAVQSPLNADGMWVPSSALTSGARGLWALYVAEPDMGAHSESPIRVGESSEAMRYRPHVIRRRQVELLRAHGDWSEVRGPVAPGELLVVDGVHRVVPGQRVICVSPMDVDPQSPLAE